MFDNFENDPTENMDIPLETQPSASEKTSKIKESKKVSVSESPKNKNSQKLVNYLSKALAGAKQEEDELIRQIKALEQQREEMASYIQYVEDTINTVKKQASQ